MSGPLCCRPGCTEPHDNWPDDTGHLCQEHWEEHCSREWWDNLDRAGVREVLA